MMQYNPFKSKINIAKTIVRIGEFYGVDICIITPLFNYKGIINTALSGNLASSFVFICKNDQPKVLDEINKYYTLLARKMLFIDERFSNVKAIVKDLKPVDVSNVRNTITVTRTCLPEVSLSPFINKNINVDQYSEDDSEYYIDSFCERNGETVRIGDWSAKTDPLLSDLSGETLLRDKATIKNKQGGNNDTSDITRTIEDRIVNQLRNDGLLSDSSSDFTLILPQLANGKLPKSRMRDYHQALTDGSFGIMTQLITDDDYNKSSNNMLTINKIIPFTVKESIKNVVLIVNTLKPIRGCNL